MKMAELSQLLKWIRYLIGLQTIVFAFGFDSYEDLSHWNNIYYNPKSVTTFVPLDHAKTDSYLCSYTSVDVLMESYITELRETVDWDKVHQMQLFGCTRYDANVYDQKVWDCGGTMVEHSRVDALPKGEICSGEGVQRLLYTWGRDVPVLELPENTGIKIGGNTGIHYLVLQVHTRARNPGEIIQGNRGLYYTAIDMTLSRNWTIRPVGVYQLSTGGVIYPKKTTNLEIACELKETFKVIYPIAFRVHSHKLGRNIVGYHVTKDEKGKCHWNLIGRQNPRSPQIFYPAFNESIPIKKGDILAARCTMKGRKNVTFEGHDKDDEMCMFYMMYYTNYNDILKDNICAGNYPFQNYWVKQKVLGLNNIPMFL